MLLNNQWVIKEINGEIKKIPRNKWEQKYVISKPMGNSSKREVYSYTSLSQETRKISSKQSNLTPKETRERRTNKTQS